MTDTPGARAVGRDGMVRTRSDRRARWPHVRRGLVAAFFLVVTALLVLTARDVEWREVGRALRAYQPGTLAIALGVAAAGHLVYTTYDLLARHYTGHQVPWPRVMGAAFVSYVVNLNLGAIIGAAGFRYRLYSRFGLRSGEISRIMGFSILTNWLGYLVLGGGVFTMGDIELPSGWPTPSLTLRPLGVGMWLLASGYLVLCASPRRTVRIRGVEVALPSVRLALVQIAVSSASWVAIAAVAYTLLGAQVPFLTVLGVQLLAAVAVVILHIPAGLGVLEAVYLFALRRDLPTAEILSALVAFRGVYYLAPVLPAVTVYLLLESRSRHSTREPREPAAAAGRSHA